MKNGSMDRSDIYLMVSGYFPRPDNEWTCAFVHDLCAAIERNSQYRVVVLNPGVRNSYVFRGIQVVGFLEMRRGRWLCPWLFNKINHMRMWRALRREGVDIAQIKVAHGQLIASGTYLNELKRVLGIKTVLQFQDPDPYGMLLGTGFFATWKKWVYFVYHRYIVEKMDLLVAISENVAKVIMDAPQQKVYDDYVPMKCAMNTLRRFRKARLDKGRIYVLHNSVDSTLFSKRTDVKLQDGVFRIGCVGLFRDWKDQITLLRSIDILYGTIPELHVTLVGIHHSGTMLADCERFISERKIPVKIIPSLDHSELGDFYRSLDLFVLPSYFEGFGCVFTEAWSCGTPFITCEGQAMDDLIYPEDRHLWLCKLRDPQDLAEKIRYYYLHRPEQRLASETDIDILVPKFLERVSSL